MKISKAEARSSARSIPRIRFEDQSLTSFSGLVLFQALFAALRLTERLRGCVRHLKSSASYARQQILLLLTVHHLLGWQRLRDLDYYRDDPMVLRLLGLRRMPSVSVVSRALSQMDEKVYDEQRSVFRKIALERVEAEQLSTLTVDFDGSVFTTKARRKEGTAVGYNRAKGQRSYYPLFATLAQTGQVIDVLHRAGNVHDSNGASDFIRSVYRELRESGFRGRLEGRLDGAHFNETTCLWLHEVGIEFSVSVPFERFAKLKAIIEDRKRWYELGEDWSYFEQQWKPDSWPIRMRLLFFRHRVNKPRKGPIQLDFFEPVSTEYEYKVVLSSKRTSAASVLHFHNGRGSQEGLFAELKSQTHMDSMPSKTLIGNKVYLASALLAHNLGRELQMRATPRRADRNTFKRATLWAFEKIDSFRKRLVGRAGRLTRPQGVLTLTCAANEATATELAQLLENLAATA